MFHTKILSLENEVIKKFGFEHQTTTNVFRITANAKQAYEEGLVDTAFDFIKQAQDELEIAELRRNRGFE